LSSLSYEDKYAQLVNQSLNTLRNLLRKLDVPQEIAGEVLFNLELTFDEIYEKLEPYLSGEAKEKEQAVVIEVSEPEADESFDRLSPPSLRGDSSYAYSYGYLEEILY